MMPRHYAEVLDFDADLVLSKSHANAVLTYLVYYLALNYFLNTGYDYQEITNTLDSAIDNVAYLEDDEKVLSRKYIIALWNCKALRQGHAFDG